MNIDKYIYLLLLILILLKQVFCGFDCIQRCNCKNDDDDLLIADCTGSSYNKIPNGNPNWVIHVHTLILKYNKVTKIGANSFDNFQQLEVLNIKGNGLQFIETGAFLPLKTKNMTWLDLSQNQLKSKFLDELTNVASTLEYLNLSYNQLGEIPPAIGKMINLLVLDLSRNSLLSIPESFLPVPLRVANFSYNAIKRFGNLTFAKNVALEKLILSDSFARTDVRFEDATFAPLTNLQHLDLSRCFCRRITPNSFATMSNLKTLKLQKSYLYNMPEFRRKITNSSSLIGSNLTSIQDGYVWNNAELETLDLSHNRRLSFAKAGRTPFPPSLKSLDLSADPIKIIDDDFLSNLHDLTTLMLDGNRINNVGRRAFANTNKLTNFSMAINNLNILPLLPPSVEWLALPDNRITDLNDTEDDGRLGSMVNLRTIDLSRGSISTIRGAIFSNMSQLVRLNMSANKLQMLDDEILQISSNSHGETVGQLKVLDLQKNEICKIEGSPFITHEKLEELYIQENRITTIDQNTFKGLSSLVVLDLSVNDIEDISPNALKELVKLEVLRLNSNQMEIIWENQFGNLDHLHTLTLHDNQLLEINPQILPSIVQLSLMHNQLSAIPSLTAPKLQKLILANNNLTEIEDENIFSMTERLEYIDMYCNQDLVITDYSVFTKLINLTYLNIGQCSPSTTFVNVPLAKLKTLIMFESQVVDIDTKPMFEILPSIEDIDLSYNNITNLSPQIFDNMKNLKSIDLRGNNFVCECKIQPFVDWAISEEHHIDVVALDLYMCDSPENYYSLTLLEIIPELNCTTVTTTTIQPLTTTTTPNSDQVVKSYEIALLVCSAVIIIAGLVIFIQRRRIVGRRSIQHDGNGDQQNEAMVPNTMSVGPHCSDCCVPLFKLNLARGSSGLHRNQRLEEEHRDLMPVPSVVTSPMDESAPEEL